MPEITVYGVSVSPYVRKVLVAAAEKRICTDHQPMLPGEIPAELREHTPLGKIPFANVKGRWLADSSIISRYLEDLWPTPSLYPADAYDSARATWIEEYVDGAVNPVLGSKIVGQRLLNPLLRGLPTDESVVQAALEDDLPRYFSYLEGVLGDNEFFVGDALSVADITVASFQVTLSHADVLVDAASYPNIARHRDAMWARESFASLIEAERAMLAQMKEQAGVSVG